MNRNDRRKVDPDLLLILEAFRHKRNFTEASEKLFLRLRRLTLRIGL